MRVQVRLEGENLRVCKEHKAGNGYCPSDPSHLVFDLAVTWISTEVVVFGDKSPGV